MSERRRSGLKAYGAFAAGAADSAVHQSAGRDAAAGWRPSQLADGSLVGDRPRAWREALRTVFLADPKALEGPDLASQPYQYRLQPLCAVTILVFSVSISSCGSTAGVVGAAAAMLPDVLCPDERALDRLARQAAGLSVGGRVRAWWACSLLPPMAFYLLIGPDRLLIMLFLGELLVAIGRGLGLALDGQSVMAWSSAAQRHGLIEARIRAETANDAKSAFVAMVSHELRTPISAIVASAHELEATAGAGVARSSAQLIVNACGMLRTLLNDLLDFSKIEAGQMSVEAIPFDPRILIDETVRLWRAETKKKGVRLKLEGARDLPDWVHGDPMRLRQILNNLLSNAVKFTEQGAITLQPSSAEAAERRSVPRHRHRVPA